MKEVAPRETVTQEGGSIGIQSQHGSISNAAVGGKGREIGYSVAY
jgi:hypothetical protein